MTERYQAAIEAMAAAHKEDPSQTIVDGKEIPDEWLYIQRIVQRLEEFKPDASEELRLATHCQHFRRWEIPRSDYPEGKMGYFHWRTYLAKYQADKVAEILKDVGYPEETAECLRSLIAKEKLHQDEDSQALEDVVCLVFMEHYLEDFAAKNPHLEFKRIILKTAAKMSEEGIEEIKNIKFPGEIQRLVDQVIM
ncbi:MAG TPA: DUF4202 domain-containing protein [Sunxiuqinia sp.]|nr:DUF4202 domain-containing protein [Sunxiuqinia sp.]